ncbi:hypothetical protein GGR28_001978 [Lewinella aquimaris]|uniref:Uncharacterized protein n=1 Tax=Neolewinella aquimaris TaxID=1835722 RepID=A0A840EBH8_9BACT|nr:T9SS type A sorting domain-containing protein [Neolewinella aquimaris]MBB4079358.1 hypothetical protein [Neolewinella aquimaris]
MKQLYVILLIICWTVTLVAQTDICTIEIDPETRVATFANGEDVQVYFEYSTDEAAGVRIFIRPFSGGSLSPSYAASGSPLYLGDGSGTAEFTISAGEVAVDELRFHITNADQSITLREFYVPVDFTFGENGVNGFSPSHDRAFATFLHDEEVSIDFDYSIARPDGVRIFIRPVTGGALTPNYAASGSPIFTGSGSAAASFRISAGNNVRVDSFRVTMTSADQSEELQQFFVPVNWYWSNTRISEIAVVGGPFTANGVNQTVEFTYETQQPGGVRIFPRPITAGELTPDYAACGSPIYDGSGSGTCTFTIQSGNQRVDHIRFRVTSADQTTTLLEVRYPVDLYFGQLHLAGVQSCPPSPARLPHDEPVNTTYTLTNGTSTTVRVFARPLTEGNLSPGYAASGSPAYPVGTTDADDFFRIQTGNTVVDQLRFLVTNDEQSADYATFLYDVHYEYRDATPVATDRELATLDLRWSLFPNPTSERAVLRVTPRVSQTVSVEVHDALGRLLLRLPRETLVADVVREFVIEPANVGMRTGVHYVRLVADGYSITEPLIVR